MQCNLLGTQRDCANGSQLRHDISTYTVPEFLFKAVPELTQQGGILSWLIMLSKACSALYIMIGSIVTDDNPMTPPLLRYSSSSRGTQRAGVGADPKEHVQR